MITANDLHPGSVSKEVPPAGYVSYLLNPSGIWREIVPFTSLSEKGSGHKNAKKTTRNAKFTSKSR